MSLIDEMMSPCKFMRKDKAPDGEGGLINTWVETSTFNASIVIESSTLATIAEALKQNKVYTVTFNKNVALEKGDVIKRMTDGATFRITSDSSDKIAPAVSTLDIAQVKAERWELS